MPDHPITITTSKRRSFGYIPLAVMAMSSAVLLAACGDNPPPVISDNQPAPQKVVAEAPQDETSDPAPSVSDASTPDQTTETAALAATPTLTVTEDPIEAERQQTIQSIIDQLKLRDAETLKQRLNDNETVSTGLTTETLKTLDTTTDDKVVWSIDAGDNATPQNVEPIIPEGRDPSLAAEALAAAFALVRDHSEISSTLVQDEGTPIEVISKPEGGIRAAMLAPLQGRASSIGKEMQLGAELAIFTLNNPNIDLTFHDTSSGINGAMNAAMMQNPDVIIGPLFADHTKAAKPIAQIANVPILSFSNDSSAAGGDVWLIGQTPEQEIETVLRHALATVSPIADANRDQLSVGLVVQDSPYGQRISQHAVDMLIADGGVTAEMLTLNAEVIGDENALRASIKNMTKWLPPSSEGEERPPRFDIVIIAGDVSFGLRVAPVLSWYDLDPAKVKYLGTSGWAAPAILQEPSLEGGWFASQPSEQSDQFQSLWSVTNQGRASTYALMAFDAVAMVSTLSPDQSGGVTQALTSGPGFNGFSGAFKLAPSGQNIRKLEIREISSGQFKVIVPAKAEFN